MQFVQSDDIGKIHKHRSVNFCTSMFLDSCMFLNLAGNTKKQNQHDSKQVPKTIYVSWSFHTFHLLVPPLCWWPFGGCSHLCQCSILFQQECKIACFHSGATWSSQFVPIFPLSTLLMVSSCGCLHGATPVIDYVCLCFICAHKKSYMGHLQKQGADPCFS